MPTSLLNEDIANDYIEQAIDIERFKANLRRQTTTSLQSLERELILLLSEIDPSQGRSKVRIADLAEKIPDVVDEYYKEERKRNEEEILALLLFLRKRPQQIIEKRLSFSLMNIVLSESEVKSITRELLLEGAPAREWWERQPILAQQRVLDVVRKGVANGDELPALIAAVRGTRKNNYTDGIMALTKREAESVVVTAVQKGANDLLLATYAENADVIKSVQQKSTLDGRTTDVCKAYSGLVWSVPDFKPVGHNLPFNGGTPRHWRCRSVVIPITRSFAELRDNRLYTLTGTKVKGIDKLLDRQLAADGFSKDKIQKTKSEAQASMDGQVPKDLNYEQWLRTKSLSFQKEILGAKKYELWKKGKISFRDLVDQSGSPMTVEDLIKKYR